MRVSGGRFDDAVNGVALDQIEAVLTGTDRSVTLTSLRARTTNGGSVTGRGNVGLDPNAGYPGRVDLDLTNAALVNSDLMRLVAEGRLGVEGAFLRDPASPGASPCARSTSTSPTASPAGCRTSMSATSTMAAGARVPPPRRAPPPARRAAAACRSTSSCRRRTTTCSCAASAWKRSSAAN